MLLTEMLVTTICEIKKVQERWTLEVNEHISYIIYFQCLCIHNNIMVFYVSLSSYTVNICSFSVFIFPYQCYNVLIEFFVRFIGVYHARSFTYITQTYNWTDIW